MLSAQVARLATIDPDGRPHLVPIVFVIHGQTLYTAVDAKPKRSRRLRRIENARGRPDVTVLADHYEDDWSRLWWVRIDGRARVLDAGDEAELALLLLIERYEQYRSEKPGLPVLDSDGKPVGVARWAVFSYALKQNIAIALVDAGVDDADALVVRAPDGDRAARVHPIPFV